MRFNNGMFGACICILAILGTAIGGFVLNVHEDQREVTQYNLVADVSGLFSYSDAPEYIDYNPSTNYTGYTPGAVTFSPSATANNYRYIITDGETSTNSLTVDYESDYYQDYALDHFGGSPDGSFDVRILWNGLINFGTPRNIPYGSGTYNAIPGVIGSGDERTAHITALSNILEDLAGNITSYSALDISISYDTTYPVLFYAGSWDAQYTTMAGNPLTIWTATMNEGNSMPDRMVVSTASNMVTAYRDGVTIWTATADNVGVLAWYLHLVGNSPSSANPSVTLTASMTGNPSYGYMNPNAGAKATTTQATWLNGYENSVIEVKVVKNGDTSAPYQGTHFEIGTDFGIDFAMQGAKLNIYYGALSDTSNWTLVNLGNWLGAQMRIDALSGNITITPTNEVDLTKTVEPTAYSTVLEGVLTPGTLSSFKVETANGGVMPSMKFQVTDTRVFLNTYNTVMIDPTIEISDYFPNYTDYRLNFYSFALIGDSMTINGQVCPINRDNGTITFTNVAGFEFTKKLENFYVTFNDGRTYLTFVNDNSTYDLGDTVSTVISFSGWWFFTTGLYEIVDGVETFWNWDLNGFQASAGECLLIFLGIIIAGIILYSVFGRGKLHFFDWLIIIFAVFIGSALLGF